MDVINYSKIKKVESDLLAHKEDYANRILNGKNMFNKATSIQGFTLSEGNLVENPNYYTSTYIEVSGNTTYINNSIISISFFTDNKVYISRKSSQLANTTFTTPVNAKYIRVAVYFTLVDFLQIELGNEMTEFERYNVKVKDLQVDKKNLSIEFVEDEKLLNILKNNVVTSKNLINLKNSIDGYVLSSVDGSLVANENYRAFDYMLVEPGGTYISSTPIVVAQYDKSGNHIVRKAINANIPLVMENNTAQVRVAVHHAALMMAKFEKGDFVTSYEPYYDPGVRTSSVINGKNILFLGDSNTHLNNFPNMIAKRTGCISFNGGAGATRLTDFSNFVGSTSYDKFNGCAIADAISTGDWSYLESAANAIDVLENQNIIPKWRSQLQNIQDACMDMDKLYAIVLQYGTNDANNDLLALGEPASLNRYEWNGAINYFIKAIQTTYPHIQLYFCSPIFRQFMPGSPEATGEDKNSDEWSKSIMMPVMVEAMRDRTKENHIPFKDLYNVSGINKYTSPYYLKDRTHYSVAGDVLISEKIESFLLND